MNSESIFKLALGVESPWEVKEVKFEVEGLNKRLNIHIDFKRGSKFADAAGKLCGVYDTKQKHWRHLDFFQHECHLYCRVPRIQTSTGEIKQVDVPWARSQSGFSLLFEAYVMSLIEHEMPMNKVADLVGENAHRVWTIFNHWLELAYQEDTIPVLEKLGLDETSRRKGHQYVTLAVDLDERRVLHVAEGKDKASVKKVKDYLAEKRIDAKRIIDASMDMSPSYISGVSEYFPNANIHFDRFHVVKLLNEAMDDVRKAERKEHQELKGHKYTFLKNADNLSQKKQKELNKLITLFPVLGEAYRLKELFNDLWDMDDEEQATAFLVDWCQEVEEKGIVPFQGFIKTIKSHWTGIVNFCETYINNGILEGINNKVQLAKRRARGYRQVKNFINMIYFLCGKLTFSYPLNSS